MMEHKGVGVGQGFVGVRWHRARMLTGLGGTLTPTGWMVPCLLDVAEIPITISGSSEFVATSLRCPLRARFVALENCL